MDYTEWMKNIDLKKPEECVAAISDLIERNLPPEQTMYAIQLLVHDSALVYNNQLKNRIKIMKRKSEEKVVSPNCGSVLKNNKKIIVKVKK